MDKAVADVKDGVDAGVAGDGDGGSGNALGVEIGGGAGGGGEMKGGEAAGENAVHLLGEGLEHVVGAEAGFHMGDGDVMVKGGEGAAERAGGVALDDDQIGLLGRQDGFEAGEDARGGLGQRLAGAHEIEVMIRVDLKGGQDLIEHLPVLRGDADTGLDLRRGGEAMNERAKLDRLRAGAEDEKHFLPAKAHAREGRAYLCRYVMRPLVRS